MRPHLALAAILVVGACSDAGGPATPTPRRSPAAASATAITLDQLTGIASDPIAWGQGETHIGKGFDPNPHLGDAIVVTFWWKGSSNTIIQVTDHLCDVNSTPVGNTYTLVDYVTRGGISMATYVATNVQGFPDPAPTSDHMLCVHAIFSNALSEGGMLLSAYQGVDPVTAAALGDHHAAAGAGSSMTVADPGAITIGAGALAYGLTMSDGVVGTDPPPGFTYLDEVDDDVVKADGEYQIVAGAGTVDPRWNWYFTSSRSWLATIFALNPAGGSTTNQSPTAAFASSCSALTCAFTSTSSDPDGTIATYSWTFGDGATAAVQNPSHTYAADGADTVTLTVTDNGGATNSVSHVVTVTQANQSPTAAFTSSCSALTCAFTSTSSDPDGTIATYRWTFGDGGTGAAQNPSHTYTAAGTYTVHLTVTDNQGDTGSVSHDVPAGTGITLDQLSGITDDGEPSGQGETDVGKGFQPANPHLGDAIVATFFWHGSTNTIIQVTDRLCDANSTPVGNTYTLVEYVTAGGYSMATYVATNVQGFPDPAPTDSYLLCVHGIFSNQITEGGMILAAYQGVDPNSATALGAHLSAVGSASTVSPGGPGAISAGAGALAYAVTMVDGAIGSDPPPGFTNVTEVSDAVVTADAEYQVLASGGSVDPQWTWYFASPHSWLATVFALNPAGGSTNNQAPAAAPRVQVHRHGGSPN